MRSASLDHETTSIYRIDRSGLWHIVPGSAGERTLINQAMRKAEQTVHHTANTKKLRDRARQRAEQVLKQFFNALGWRVRVVWAQS